MEACRGSGDERGLNVHGLRDAKELEAAVMFEKLARFASSMNRTIASMTVGIYPGIESGSGGNHGRDTRDEQTRFQKWVSDSRSRRWQHDIGPSRRRRIGSGPPR